MRPQELIILWIIVWILVVPVVAVALVAALITRTEFKDATALVPGLPEPWLHDVVLQLSGLRGHRVAFLSPTVLEVSLRRRAAWAILVAVFFFPLGLLALLVTSDDIGTVVATEEGRLTRVRMRGRFSPAAVEAINRTIPEPAAPITAGISTV